ncbi:MAG: hypothetical protein ABFD50_00340 [Smithella sp.]
MPPIYKTDLNSPIVNDLINIVQSKGLTIREAAEAFDAAKARLGDVMIQNLSPVEKDDPKNGYIRALRELSLV